MKEKVNIWKLCFIISIVIIVALLIWILNLKQNKKITENQTKSNTSTSTSQSVKNDSEDEEYDEEMKQIRINEDFSKEGTVENLENVRWSNANIMQFDDEMDIDIMLNNESQTEKINATTLTVKLLDKQGNVIKEQDVEMKEIPSNYGYTTLNLSFDITEVMIIYDIQIVAK